MASGVRNGAGGFHLGGAATTHSHGQGALLAQLPGNRGKVDGLFGLAHGRKVDQHGVKVEKTGRIGHALGQVHGKLRRVRGLEHHCHHGQ